MKTVRLPLVSTIESRTESVAQDSRLVNAVCETRGNRKELVKRPGLLTATVTPTLPNAQANGLFPGIGLLWADINGTLYGITPSGASSSFGSIGAGSPYLTSFAQTTVVASASGGTATYTNPGTYSFVVPPLVTSISVVVVAGGGGGGGGAGSSGDGGSGGGAGQVVSANISVTPGNTVAVVVGAAGTGGSGGGNIGPAPAGLAGANSSVGTTVALGGAAGAGGLYNGSRGNGHPGANGYTSVGGYPTALGGASGGIGAGGAGGAGYGAGGGGGGSSGFGAFGGFGNTGASGFVQIQYSPTINTNNPVITLIHNGFSGFYVAAGGSAVSQVWNAAAPYNGFFPQGPLAQGAVFLDGYIFVMTTSGRIYNCQPNDPTSWNAINFILANTDPGNGVAIARHYNYVVAFTQWSTNFFYDAGNPTGSPLSPYTSATVNIGCAAGGTVAQCEESLFWVGQSKLQGKSVYMLNGLTPTRISTRYIEKYLNTDSLTDVRAISFKIAGHTLYALTLHGQGLYTFVYDVEEKLWYQWTTTISGVESYFRPAFFAQFNNQYFMLDDDNGMMYNLSWDVFQDVANPISVRAVTERDDFGTTGRKFYRAARIVGDINTTSVTLSHSEDDYNTYSTGRSIDMSVKRPQIYQLGSGRRSSWQVKHSDNTPLRLEALELDIDISDT